MPPKSTTPKTPATKTTAKAKPKAASTAKPKAAAKKTTTATKTPVVRKKAAKLTPDELPIFEGGIRHLVIVESPAKAKTIRKILGSGYEIKASVGHVRDLPAKKLGVDIKNHFAPEYEILENKTDVVADIRAAAAVCDTIYLAADPDREGEAIAWHIASLLKKPAHKIRRIEFHEITKTAILEAMNHPRDIDQRRVDAQQARRVLDRLVGYKLSPLLWQKVTKGLSAGRVQSVTVRIICEREDAILAFVPVEYWSIAADVHPQGKPDVPFVAELSKWKGEKPELPNAAAAQLVQHAIEHNPIVVQGIVERESKRNPSPPYITSSLQRDASNRMGYAVKRTMQVAQKLYEGITLGSEGPVGLITYMRTDSTRVSDEAKAEAKDFILQVHGAQYYPSTPREYSKKGKSVQDAHEAIRPTSVFRTPEVVAPYLNDEQLKLYTLIWDRFVASEMESAKLQSKTLEMLAGDALLKLTHTQVMFPGYMAVLHHETKDAEEGKRLPALKKGDVVNLIKVNAKQHFTEPPPRFNEASLVKMLEEQGIGRPSTYAPTIATVQDRGYVRKDDRTLRPTELGRTVNDLLVKHFNDVVDMHFTASMEAKLDEIATQDNVAWQDVIQNFYEPFELTLKQAGKEMQKVDVIIEGQHCPLCQSAMALKTSWFGSPFLGCVSYPDCKGTKRLTKDMQPVPDDRPSDEACLECKGAMVIRYGRYGEYLACPNEACKARRPLVKRTGVNCQKCATGEIVEKKSGKGKIFYGCNQYPKCDYTLWNKPINRQCPTCNSLMFEKVLKKGTFHTCSNKECGFQEVVEPTAEA
jgi:DNA topoisomerase I